MGLFDRFKQAVEPVSNKTVITAPVSGELLQLSETTEPVFSSEMMGKGVAINPSESTIIAPGRRHGHRRHAARYAAFVTDNRHRRY